LNKNKTIRLVTILMLTLFALCLLSTGVQPANALIFPRSSNVALVPGPSCINGGTLYTGSSWPDVPPNSGFTFTSLSPNSIRDDATDPIVAGGYDTVMLLTANFNFATYWADADFQSRITSFVNLGGKLIIYTSESSSLYANNFASFIYPFTVDTPGQTGTVGGTIVNIADDTLSSSTMGDDSYIDISLLTSGTDAVGDCTVMTSVDPNWYIDMTAINVNNVGGPAHTYAFYGAGLIIFNGLDIDFGSGAISPNNSNGAGAIQMVWWRELCGQDIGPGQSVSGLTLTPANATNVVDTTHTVTATVRDSINDPVANVVVNFTILSGPSAGTVAVGTTDTNGEVSFSWSSSAEGTDVVQVAINGPAGAVITATAVKIWYITPTNVVPEVPFGTIAAFTVMCVGLAFFAAKGKIHKISKLHK
jgi:hypothetical protein